MLKSLEKIISILNLEIQGKYQNKAIIGGLDKFFPHWIEDAKKDGVPDRLFTQIQDHFINYAAMELPAREISTQAIVSTIHDKSSENSITSSVIPQKTPAAEKTIHPHQKSESLTSHDQNSILGMPSGTSKKIGLDSPISILPGIGSVKTGFYMNLGIQRVGDLIYNFPRRYDDFSTIKPINRIEYGEDLTIIATVQSHMTTPIRKRNQTKVEVVVSDGTGFLRLVFFRSQKYVQSFENRFKNGTQLVISGKVDMYLGRFQMNNPMCESLEMEHLNTSGILPVYPLTSGISQGELRKNTKQVINYYAEKIQDYLPPYILKSAEIVSLPSALEQVHFPDSMESLRVARDRLAFDEIFFLQLGVQQQKQDWVKNNATMFSLSEPLMDAITYNLPFQLTNAQNRVIGEILQDLSSGHPMNRLIQGDVGSGKTVVAAITATAVGLGGGQTALMAPTSILSEQHFQTLQKMLVSTGEKSVLPFNENEIMLLTGDTSTQERDTISEGCKNGSIKILIGTHALIEDTVVFDNLQLAIIDEQHRFGIAQRTALRQKGTNPHLLVMSATPIPRSLALTIFGDLDLSIIDEMPLGRIPVSTQIIHPFAREKAYEIIREEVSRGHQAFIVYPLIEKNEDEEQKAAVDEHEYLNRDVFPELKVGLLHGKMSPAEKETVMRDLREKKYNILVSTTVIEVGVDVPNATVIVVEGADRFGLAQLHQLRGRVGRGGDQAYCILIPENEDALENARLAAMTETNDGFLLAEVDLKQRGPGDFIGFRQSGFADLQMAKLTDLKLIEKARNFAEAIFTDDPLLEKPEHKLLSQKLSSLWQSTTRDIS